MPLRCGARDEPPNDASAHRVPRLRLFGILRRTAAHEKRECLLTEQEVERLREAMFGRPRLREDFPA